MVEAVDSPNQLIDIIPPAIPPAVETSDMWLVTITLVAIVSIVSMIVFAYWRWYRAERQQCLRRLDRLRNAFKAQELSPREVAYWLAAFLKQYLRILYLAPGVTPSVVVATEQKRWNAFMLRLHEFRYAPTTGGDQEVLALLVEARYWMRRLS